MKRIISIFAIALIISPMTAHFAYAAEKAERRQEQAQNKEDPRDWRQNIREILNDYSRARVASSSNPSTQSSSTKNTSSSNGAANATSSAPVNTTAASSTSGTVSVYQKLQSKSASGSSSISASTNAINKIASPVKPYLANSKINQFGATATEDGEEAYPQKEMSLPLSISLAIVSLSGILSGALLVSGKVSFV